MKRKEENNYVWIEDCLYGMIDMATHVELALMPEQYGCIWDSSDTCIDKRVVVSDLMVELYG